MKEPLHRDDVLPEDEPSGERPPEEVAGGWGEVRRHRLAVLGVAVLMAVLLGSAGFVFLHSRPAPVVITTRSPGAVASSSPGPGPVLSPGPSPQSPPAAGVTVHVAGAVRKPGVVTLVGPSRVVDAVRAAGGPAEDALLDQLNLARVVADGERVYVPRRGEPTPPMPTPADTSGSSAAPSNTAPVDLNTASEEELDRLPGIGPALAGRILEYRRAHGPFRNVGQLVEVPGIGDKLLAQLRDRVRIG